VESPWLLIALGVVLALLAVALFLVLARLSGLWSRGANELGARLDTIDAQNERLKLAQSRVERYGQPRGLVVTQDKFEEIRAEAKVAEQDLIREQQDQKMAQLELDRSQAALDQRTIRSTIDAIVTEKKLSAGEFVNQEGYIVALARLDPLYVEVFLPVVYYKQVSVGMEAKVRPAPPIEDTYTATVSVVDRVFDPASGTFGVRLSLPNPNKTLPGGQRCKVSFAFEGKAQAGLER